MSIEEKLKELILQEYKSLRQFAPYTGLPCSTINAILKRGVLNANLQNVFKICEVLGISADALRENKIVKSDLTTAKDIETISDISSGKDFVNMLVNNYKSINIDNVPLSKSETEFLIDGMEIIIGQIRNKRKRGL